MFKAKKSKKSASKASKVVVSTASKIKFRKRMINNFKLLAKDLKRARWNNVTDSRKTFVKVAIFIVLIALALYGIAIGFTALWNVLGVGPNE